MTASLATLSSERLHDLRDAAVAEVLDAVRHASEAVSLLDRSDARLEEVDERGTGIERRQSIACAQRR